MKNIIKVENLTKIYNHSEGQVNALKDITFSIDKGDFVSITGPSGSGKTTLLLAIGGLIKTTSGNIEFEGKKINVASDKELANYRKRNVGFVMQNFSLIPYMTALQNVMVALGLNRIPRLKQISLAAEVLELVGLRDRKYHFPRELSAGQQQRVAIARALVNNPSVIFADEPTGNLDPSLSLEILELLKEINHKQSITIMMVTHSPEAAKFSNVKIKLQDGSLII